MSFKITPAEERKFLVVLVAFVGEALSQGLLAGQVATWATLVLGALSVIGVRQVPNDAPSEGV